MSRRLRILLFLVLSGCSTHPMADFCDYFKPGKVGPVTVQGGPYGGVAVPQGAIVPPAPLPGSRPLGDLPPPLPPPPPIR
jgi:hypothetical protein